MLRKQHPRNELSRRERQIMDILYELGTATAEQVRSRLPDPPSYSAARAMLARLEEKGHVVHVEEDLRYVYSPTVAKEAARESAIARLVRVFFDGSPAQAVTGLLGMSAEELSEEELDRLRKMIEQARRSKDAADDA
ncbi:MAG: BlaI/MecI/CopY family transcriptional regulator [Thermoanaerobaculia bacterium]